MKLFGDIIAFSVLYWIVAAAISVLNSSVPCPPWVDCKDAANSEIQMNLLWALLFWIGAVAITLLISAVQTRRKKAD